jgi:nicotinamidase-related amidase
MEEGGRAQMKKKECEKGRREFLKGSLAVGAGLLAGITGSTPKPAEGATNYSKEDFKMAEWKIDGKPGLVVMHMQSSILGDELKGNPYYNEFNKAIRESGMIDRTRELLKAFRDRNLPVVFVNAMMGMGGLQRKLPAYGKLFDMIRANISTLDNYETASKVIPELGRRPEEPVLINWLLGAFSYSGLDTWLKVNGVNTVVLAGFATHSVVFNALIQACDLWYSVVAPRDAMTTWLKPLGETMLNELFPFYSLVTTTKDVIAHL